MVCSFLIVKGIITEPRALLGGLRHFARFTGMGWVHLPAKQGMALQDLHAWNRP